MRYTFECEGCGNEVVETEFRPIGGTLGRSCEICGGLLRRSVCFVFQRGMSEHWNPTLGRYVTNSRDFRDGLKIASETQSIATGVDSNIVPVDLRDPDACGVTAEGLDETFRVRHDAGLVSRGEEVL